MAYDYTCFIIESLSVATFEWLTRILASLKSIKYGIRVAITPKVETRIVQLKKAFLLVKSSVDYTI